MSKILNEKIYLERMDKSMNTQEKLFFVGKIDLSKYDAIIDFGGSNGSLLSKIKSYTNSRLICIDRNFVGEDIEIEYYDKISKLSKDIRSSKYCLILSSVLHEVEWSSELHNLIFDATTVIIRDMFWDEEIVDEPHRQEIVAIKPQIPAVWQHLSVDTLSDCYQMLLKYEYIENHDHEAAEDYFVNNAKQVIDELNAMGWTIVHCEKYILPYKKEKVKNDFGIDLKYPTHIRAIYTQLGNKYATQSWRHKRRKRSD